MLSGAKIVGRAKQTKAALRAELWHQLNRNILVIASWHQISPRFDPARHHRYTWTALATFERQLDYLESRFRIIPLEEAFERASRNCLGGRFAALTFDDGDVSMADHVLPLLRRRALPATFFVNTAYLGRAATYWFPILAWLEQNGGSDAVPERLIGEARQLRRTPDPQFYDRVRQELERFAPIIEAADQRMVSEDWLAQLDGPQFALGCHGHEHQRYALMSPEWQRGDLRQNIERLGAFKAFRRFFAVPFGRSGDWSEETIRIARAEGLGVALAGGGLARIVDGCFERIPSDERPMAEAIAAATISLPLLPASLQ